MFPDKGNFYLRLRKARWHRLEKDPCEFLRSDSWEFARVFYLLKGEIYVKNRTREKSIRRKGSPSDH